MMTADNKLSDDDDVGDDDDNDDDDDDDDYTFVGSTSKHFQKYN